MRVFAKYLGRFGGRLGSLILLAVMGLLLVSPVIHVNAHEDHAGKDAGAQNACVTCILLKQSREIILSDNSEAVVVSSDAIPLYRIDVESYLLSPLCRLPGAGPRAPPALY